ncbi:MAG: family 16 glycosylhydrolase [Fibrobacter sp.]|nr:family 16 glycosylhydrolase [Fibrobacter sp.]
MIHFTQLMTGILLSSAIVTAQTIDPAKPDASTPPKIDGMTLVWNDEFSKDGKPDAANWRYETGFVRNQELQWYQSDNASVKNGVLVIEGRKQQVKNPNYVSGSTDWKKNRQYAQYTSSSINSSGLKTWKFGRFDIRARINTQKGSWPAIWTLGVNGEWPSNGEIDILEFYQVSGVPGILANFAWGTTTRWQAKWDGANKPLSYFVNKDPMWVDKFHVWTMDWGRDTIRLLLDGELMNEALVKDMNNPDGSNPFLQNHYILLNLALGANGGDPSGSTFPILYEVDYVRVYQKAVNAIPASTPVVPVNGVVFDQSNRLLRYNGNVSGGSCVVSIYSMNGMLVQKRALHKTKSEGYSAVLSALPAGIYAVNIGDGSFVGQLLVK